MSDNIQTCPSCGHDVRFVDGLAVPHDIEGLEPIGEGYFSGKNKEGVGHKQCFGNCPRCRKLDTETNHPRGMIFIGWGRAWETCPACDGTTKATMAYRPDPPTLPLPGDGYPHGEPSKVSPAPAPAESPDPEDAPTLGEAFNHTYAALNRILTKGFSRQAEDQAKRALQVANAYRKSLEPTYCPHCGCKLARALGDLEDHKVGCPNIPF